tara:strand:- start:134 stop:748 length:615 start_codon:yes stop_codon:yes gene_type:complete
MVYYLGRDVKVYLNAEVNNHVYVNSSKQIHSTAAGGGTCFARQQSEGMVADAKVTDLTSVDLGIGATDEDIAYIGQRTPLKAEIKKETTITLTRKKLDDVWDIIFNGDGDGVKGRWGIGGNVTAGSTTNSHTGLEKPTVNYGYRIFVQLKDSTEIFTVRNATITSHSVTLNADGVTEETLEFVSHVDPKIATTAYTTVTGATEL